MNVSNKPFILFETLIGGWIVSHTIVNETLQSILLIVSIAAGIVGLFKALKGKGKKQD